jgi:alkanesulfonate monooxygenase SsuD/methylene tetrahydromethanopterin reductase-like flavin-dependent oxidoreductase (luciferase family)
MEFGIFDHVDRNRLALADYYEERLKIVEAIDRAGFYSYHIAEHHATPLGMAASPSVFLAAVAQRTKRLRFGPLIYALPLYHPLRMIEEICMLDQMSGGRLDIGFGRGASPIVRLGLSGRTLTFHGKHFNYDNVPMELEPFQKPHPPLWYGVHATDSAARCAKAGINAVTLDSVAATKSFTDSFHAAFAESGRDTKTKPKFGLGRFLVVADTDEEANRIAAHAYPMWHESFNWLFEKFDSRPNLPRPPTYPELVTSDRGIAGSPATVTRIIRDQMTEGGCDYFVAQMAFGEMPFDAAMRSIDLFVREVMPALRSVN